jgi:AraC-like DNA-binding protein
MPTADENYLLSQLAANGLTGAAARALFDELDSRSETPVLGLRRASHRRREKCFGLGRPKALDRNAKVRIMHWARCLSRRTEKGRHYGKLTAKFVEVLRVLLWEFHNRHSGACFPSLATIAEAASCSRATVATAIKALEGEGLLSWVHRIKRIREPCADLFGGGGWRWRVVRTSNGYNFNDPKGCESKFQSGTAIQVSFSGLEGKPERLRRNSLVESDGPFRPERGFAMS